MTVLLVKIVRRDVIKDVKTDERLVERIKIDERLVESIKPIEESSRLRP